MNLTYYGLLNANAVVLAVLTVFVLLAAAGMPLDMIFLITVGLVVVFAPASKLIAMWVEKRNDTFSVGGVAFAGFILAPLLLCLGAGLRHWGGVQLPVMTIMSGAAIAEIIHTDLITGLRILWNPITVLVCQGICIAIFLYMGTSRVTGAHISLFVCTEKRKQANS